MEKEKYWKRFNWAILGCANVHSEDENVTIYVDDWSPKINMLVVRHGEIVRSRDLTFVIPFHFDQLQDEA